MNSFQLHILAADQVFYEGQCESIVVPTGVGQYGILAHHSNMISAVVPGKLSFRVPGEDAHTLPRVAAVSGGLVKVENNEVLVLVDSAVRLEDIDIQRARQEADAAREAMLQKRSIQEYRTAEANLRRAVNRLRVSRSRH